MGKHETPGNQPQTPARTREYLVPGARRSMAAQNAIDDIRLKPPRCGVTGWKTVQSPRSPGKMALGQERTE